MYTKDSELVKELVGRITGAGGVVINECAEAESIASMLNAERREWTAEDVSDEQVKAVEAAIADRVGGSQINQAMAARVTIAAAANIMGVPKPQPAAAVAPEDQIGRVLWEADSILDHCRDQSGWRIEAIRKSAEKIAMAFSGSQPTAEGPGGGA